MTVDAASGEAVDWAGRLVVAQDQDLENLAHTPFIDAGERFNLGAGDQALCAAAFSYLHRGSPGSEALVLALPRGKHDVALSIALACQVTQLSRLGALITRAMCPWRGSIVVIGQNTGVQRRLGEIQVAGTFMHGGVANALHAFRVRGDGSLADPQGSIEEHSGGSGRLLYLNTRIGWPTLPEERDPLVIIDATRIGQPATVGKALEWTRAHGARHVIVLTHLGDRAPLFELERAEMTPFVFDLAADIRSALVHELGMTRTDARMSSNELLAFGPPGLRVRKVNGSELAESLETGLVAMLSAPAREVWPFALSQAHRVLSGLRRLSMSVDQYNHAAAIDPWLSSLGSAVRTVERYPELRALGSSRTFAITQWGTVRNAAIAAYALAEQSNPKADALIDEVERALRQPDRSVIVRVADRAAAVAMPKILAASLGDDVVERVTVARCGEVLPWLPSAQGPVTEILPGAPPTWDISWLFTGESTDRVVLAYAFEVGWIERSILRCVHQVKAERETFFGRFHLGGAPDVAVEIELPEVTATAPTSKVAEFNVDEMWDKLLELDEPPPERFEPSTEVVRHPSRSTAALLEIRTDDGKIHLIAKDVDVEVFVAGKYRVRHAEELEAGDVLLYTTGTGRESIFTRLVAASHRTMGVDELDLILRRFRDACRSIRSGCRSWSEANQRLKAAGASATTQLAHWASGETIAPADANDVAVVARVAKDEQLAANWFRIDALAQELRRLHQSLGRDLSAAITEAMDGGGPHLAHVTRIVGADVAEIFDEFTTATVVSVNPH